MKEQFKGPFYDGLETSAFVYAWREEKETSDILRNRVVGQMSMTRKRDQISKGWTNKEERNYGDLVLKSCAGKCCHCYLASPDSHFGGGLTLPSLWVGNTVILVHWDVFTVLCISASVYRGLAIRRSLSQECRVWGLERVF